MLVTDQCQKTLFVIIICSLCLIFTTCTNFLTPKKVEVEVEVEETKKIYKIIKSLKIPGWISGWPVLSLVVVVLLLHYGPVGADAQAQKKIYGEESSNKHCFDIGAGWTSISSNIECDQAAVALGFADVDSSQNTASESGFPPGCWWYSNNGGNLHFNTDTTATSACSGTKCACTLICQPGTFQNEEGKTTCKSCTVGFYQDGTGTAEPCKACSTGTYSTASASSCDYTATTCPKGMYSSGTAACTLCGEGKYNDLTGQTSDAVCKTCPGVTNEDRTELLVEQKPETVVGEK